MKARLIASVVGLATYACVTIYPTAGVVTATDLEAATVRTVHGHEYTISNDGCDWYPGDAVALLMHDNATPEVADDVPLMARYIGGADCLTGLLP